MGLPARADIPFRRGNSQHPSIDGYVPVGRDRLSARPPEIGKGSSWLLTDVIEQEDGKKVVNRILPSSGTNSKGEVSRVLEDLESMGIHSAWVANKHPFLVYLFLSIIPLVLFGDPVGIITSEL